MTDSKHQFSIQDIEKLNQKTIESQLFTPDNVYIDLALFKDFNIGAIYADKICLQNDESGFKDVQNIILSKLVEYQTRKNDSVTEFFGDMGYTDLTIDGLMENKDIHDLIFMVSPSTKFLNTLIRHTIRNQNNSRPANRYVKTKLEDGQYTIDSIPVTYIINTFPLTLSTKCMERVGAELGEGLGVNIRFINRDPMLFDKTDWDDWLSTIECFYFDSLGKFTGCPFVQEKQSGMEFVGKYVFARKRFERNVNEIMHSVDFTQQIQMITAQLDLFFEFNWLQNNDIRLTEESEDIPIDDPIITNSGE